MAADKITIGITRENMTSLQRLVAEGRFGSELDAAKFAMAHAIKLGMPAGRTTGADTKWNVGSVDSDGSLRALLTAFYPEVTEPYRLIEHLMNTGVADLAGSETQMPDVYGTMFDA